MSDNERLREEPRGTAPLVPRPAATVILVRDVHRRALARGADVRRRALARGADEPRRALARGADEPRGAASQIEVFLMRRHAAMEFAGGVMVFPGGGVDERDRNADIAWFGPEPSWWAQRLGVETGLAEALVCAAARETFEESGVLFAGPADDPDGIVGDASVYRDDRAALASNALSFADFLRQEKLVLRADLLCPWANWVTPKEERTRRYDTYFFVGALPEGQRADGENTESDGAFWSTPQAGLDDFAEGRSFLLPPTWTQLDSLNGRTVAEVLTVERKIVAIEPNLAVKGGNWEIEFFDGERYNAARRHRSPAAPGGAS